MKFGRKIEIGRTLEKRKKVELSKEAKEMLCLNH